MPGTVKADSPQLAAQAEERQKSRGFASLTLLSKEAARGVANLLKLGVLLRPHTRRRKARGGYQT